MGLADWIRNLFEWLRNNNSNDEPSMKRSWSLRRSKNKKKDKKDKLETQSNKELTTSRSKADKKMTGSQKRKVKEILTPNGTKVKNKKKSKNKNNNTTGEEFQEVVANNTDRVANKDCLSGTASEEIQVVKNVDTLPLNTEHVETSVKNQLPVPPILNEYETKSLAKIAEILEKSKDFESKIDTFSDVKGSQSFFYIDENLQRNIEKLDRIDVKNSIELKVKRKDAIKIIYDAIERLEAKATEYENSQSVGGNAD